MIGALIVGIFMFLAGMLFGWNLKSAQPDSIPAFRQRRRIALRRHSKSYLKT